MSKKPTLLSTVRTYVTNQQKSGATGLRLLRDVIAHIEAHNDWTPAAWLIAKSDLKDARIYRSILGAVTTGITMSKTSKEALNQPSGLHFKMNKGWGFTNRWGALNDAVDRGLSFRSAEVHAVLLQKAKDDTITLEKLTAAYTRLLKKVEDGQFTMDQVLKALAASKQVNNDLTENA